MYDVNILVVPRVCVRLECFMSTMSLMGYSCRFCILLRDFGSSGMLVGGISSGNGV